MNMLRYVTICIYHIGIQICAFLVCPPTGASFILFGKISLIQIVYVYSYLSYPKLFSLAVRSYT